MERKCYVVTCKCYSGEDSVCVFYEESDAIKEMELEIKVEETNLKDQGYGYECKRNEDGAEIYTQDRDIYFEWTIEESTIR